MQFELLFADGVLIPGSILTVGAALVVTVVKYGGNLQRSIDKLHADNRVGDTKFAYLEEQVGKHEVTIDQHGKRIDHVERVATLAEFGDAMHTILRTAKELAPKTRAHGAGD